MNFSPGPSKLYPTVREAIIEGLDEGICSLSHRSADFVAIMKGTQEAVRAVLGLPDDVHVLFVGSATEAMERLIQGCVAEDSLHVVNGAFSQRFWKIAEELGKKAAAITLEAGEALGDLRECALPGKAPELVTVTYNETSTGATVSEPALRSVKEQYPDTLLALDVVSCVPYTQPDFTVVDAAFFSVQKGFGLPAGLGVLMVNERCVAKAKKLLAGGCSVGSYHSIPTLIRYAAKNQTVETPNCLGIYLLGRICRDMISYGVPRIRKETESKAAALYRYFEASPYQFFVKNKQWRSQTMIVLKEDRLQEELLARGIRCGGGYGHFKGQQMRIANFPAHSLEEVQLLIQQCQKLECGHPDG